MRVKTGQPQAGYVCTSLLPAVGSPHRAGIYAAKHGVVSDRVCQRSGEKGFFSPYLRSSW